MRTCVFVVLLLLLPAGVEAQWAQTEGPFGGPVRCLAESRDGMVILAGTPGGMYRSTSGGEDWQMVGSTAVHALAAVGPSFLAGIGTTICRSDDDGLTWTGLSTPSPTGIVTDFAFNGKVLFAATARGVFRSEDRGRQWQLSSQGLSDKYPATRLAMMGEYILAAGEDGIYRTTERDETWTFVSGLAQVHDLAYQRPSVYAAVTLDDLTPGQAPAVGIYRSNNGGMTWELLTSSAGNSEAGYTAVLVNGRSIFAGRQDGTVFLSKDEGESWSQVAIGRNVGQANGQSIMGGVYDLSVANSAVYACRDDGIFQSADNGTSWKTANTGIVSYAAETIALAGRSVLMPVNGALYRSADAGLAWEDYSAGLPESSINGFAVISNYVFVTSGEQLYRADLEEASLPHSRNDEIWRAVTPPGAGEAMLQCAGGCLFASVGCGDQRQTLHSPDNGYSWQRIGALCFDAVACCGSTLFAWGVDRSSGINDERKNHWSTDPEPTWRGLFRMVNHAAVWSRVGQNYDGVMDFQHLRACGSYLFGLDGNALYQSDNQGRTWKRLEGPTGTIHDMTAVGNTLVAATTAGVFQFAVGGLQWKDISDGMPSEAVPIKLAVNETHLYLGTKTHGLFRRPITEIVDGKHQGETVSKAGTPGMATEYGLSQNYPNPFNPVTTISYSLPSAGHVVVAIYNVLGEQISVLAEGAHPGGTFAVTWDAAEYPSGVYFCRLTAGEYMQMRKMVLMR